jgi:HTH-type transcriptional regulator, cell division transcriptional repressor
MSFSGAKLAAARLAAGMTQEQLARSIGSDQTRVSEWERGLFSPRPEQVPALAVAVGVKSLELLDIQAEGPDLEAFRLAAGLSLQAIAAALETSVSRYRRMERGERLEPPPEDLVERLADVLSLTSSAVRMAIDVARQASATRRQTRGT